MSPALQPQNTRLRRSQDRMIGGVLGGVAEHYGLNPMHVRLGYALVSLLSAGFPGALLYLALWMIIPSGESA